MNGGDCGVWSVCKVAHVSHCAGLLADSLADSEQVAALSRYKRSHLAGEGLGLCKLPRSALQRIGTRLTNPFGKTAEKRRRILADLEASIAASGYIDGRDCDDDSCDRGRRRA